MKYRRIKKMRYESKSYFEISSERVKELAKKTIIGVRVEREERKAQVISDYVKEKTSGIFGWVYSKIFKLNEDSAREHFESDGPNFYWMRKYDNACDLWRNDSYLACDMMRACKETDKILISVHDYNLLVMYDK